MVPEPDYFFTIFLLLNDSMDLDFGFQIIKVIIQVFVLLFIIVISICK